MSERLPEPDIAWYHLQTREIAVLLLLGAIVAGLSGWALLRDSGFKDPKVDAHELPPARINVNTAGEAELMALPGIGERKAVRIVEARNQAPIRNMTELAAAAGGIPQKDQDRMREFVVFE